MLSALVGVIVFGVVAFVALMVVLALVGVVFGVVGMLLTLALKLLPIVLVGWLVVKLVQRGERSGPRSRLSAADRAWLDS